MRFFLLACLLCLGAAAQAQTAATPEQAWARITALDAGPGGKLRTREEVRAAAVAHLQQQERLLRDFLVTFPAEAHAFEAKLRLARLLQIRVGFQGLEAGRAEAARLLEELTTTTLTPEQRTELDFARIALGMRTLRVSVPREREQLLTAVRRFQVDHAGERRLPALLAEVATLFDRDPETKRALLQDAQAANTDPGLKGRIADDLKKLDLVGQVVEVKFPTREGRAVDLAQYRGKVVFLLFFAEFSPPATEALAQLQRTAAAWPKEQVQVLTYSVDSSAEDLAAFIRRQNFPYPVGWDGKGWHGSLPRALGINALPTAWIFDQTGRLRSLRGLESSSDQVLGLVRSGGR